MSASLEQPQAKKSESILSVLLDLPPSCIEFTPKSITPPSLRNCFVVGTYYLEPSADGRQDADNEIGQKRSGSLVAYRLQGKNLYALPYISRNVFQCQEVFEHIGFQTDLDS